MSNESQEILESENSGSEETKLRLYIFDDSQSEFSDLNTSVQTYQPRDSAVLEWD
jgi:hypothetical protein